MEHNRQRPDLIRSATERPRFRVGLLDGRWSLFAGHWSAEKTAAARPHRAASRPPVLPVWGARASRLHEPASRRVRLESEGRDSLGSAHGLSSNLSVGLSSKASATEEARKAKLEASATVEARRAESEALREGGNRASTSGNPQYTEAERATCLIETIRNGEECESCQ